MTTIKFTEKKVGYRQMTQKIPNKNTPLTL